METGYLISTADAAVICNNVMAAREYSQELVETALERANGPFVLRIERRSMAEIKRFLAAGDPAPKAPAAAPAPKEPKKAPEAKAAPRKAPGGGPSKSQIVRDLLSPLTKTAALTMPEICKRTKLTTGSVSPTLSNLTNAGQLKKVKDGKLSRWYGNFPVQEKKPVLKAAPAPKPKGTLVCAAAKGEHIFCPRKDDDITGADCLPDDNNALCRRCPHVEAA